MAVGYSDKLLRSIYFGILGQVWGPLSEMIVREHTHTHTHTHTPDAGVEERDPDESDIIHMNRIGLVVRG